jgi:DNA-binding FrmR family transcriptional regulator
MVLDHQPSDYENVQKAGCDLILSGHIKHCVRDGIEHGDADKTIEQFTKAVERFANMK